jgi:hypothetical protein
MSDDFAEGERAIFRVDRAQPNAGGAPGAPPVQPPAPAPAQPADPAPAQPADPAPAAPEPPTVWHQDFAVVTAVVLGILLIVFVLVSQLFADNLGLDAAQTAKLDGRALIGARVIGPVTIVGVAVTLVGVWMAATEWRGRFAERSKETGERDIADPAKIIEALGKLRGAALVLVSGIVILLGVAWMTSATASAPPAPAPSTPSSTVTPTPSGSATT